MNSGFFAFRSKFSAFGLFLLCLFFIFAADALMSYMYPIVVESQVSSNLLLGIIMGFSSFVGLICDFLFPQLFKGKSWKFYVISTISIFVLFPISTYLGSINGSIFFFLFASAIWGIYYELLLFSLQKFIVSTQHKQDFAKDWGNLYIFRSLAYIIGPILGSIFINMSITKAPLAVIPFQIIAALVVVSTAILVKKKTHHSSYEVEHQVRHINMKEEFKYWKILLPSILPIFISAVIFVGIDASYWTLGGLFGIQIFGESESSLEWLVLLIYMIPTLLGSVFMSRIQIVNRKKKTSNLLLMIGGIILSLLFFFQTNNVLILVIIFISTFFVSIATALNDAVFSDLIERLGKSDIHLIGLNRVTSSLGYIIAPIALGFIADRISYVLTFSLLGVFAALTGIILFIITPRKLKLNQKQLHELELQDEHLV